MKIAVVGLGYVGGTSAACFAELGHEVYGVDSDPKKNRNVQNRKSPVL